MAKNNGSAKKNGNTVIKADGYRQRVSQTDIPAYSYIEALKVSQAVADHGDTATPLEVASAMSMSPNSSSFRMLCGASIAYGFTAGGYNAETIKLEALGQRIIRCTAEGDDMVAKREGFLRPRIIGEFLTKYDGKALPKDHQILRNVLRSMNVPTEVQQRTVDLILKGATELGLTHEIKGTRFVNLKGARRPINQTHETNADEATTEMPPPDITLGFPQTPGQITELKEITRRRVENRKVFITHGKNREFINPLKDLLGFGNWEAVVSTERESVSQPVPDKVMKDMRQCCAAVIHVDAELKLIDPDGNQHIMLNPNVMMEIGAAMALYANRFILLVRQGVKLPSNLQGLYEVRYDGDRLDGDATIRLLKAIKDINNHPLPKFDESGAATPQPEA